MSLKASLKGAHPFFKPRHARLATELSLIDTSLYVCVALAEMGGPAVDLSAPFTTLAPGTAPLLMYGPLLETATVGDDAHQKLKCKAI